MITQKERNGEADLWVWKWLKALLIHLEEDGMSSDESETDQYGNTFFSVKQVAWRVSLQNPLKLIDETRQRLKSATPTRGAQCIPRVRGNRPEISNRPPPEGLPEALFDPQWLKSFTGDVCDLTISDEIFIIHNMD